MDDDVHYLCDRKDYGDDSVTGIFLCFFIIRLLFIAKLSAGMKCLTIVMCPNLKFLRRLYNEGIKHFDSADDFPLYQCFQNRIVSKDIFGQKSQTNVVTAATSAWFGYISRPRNWKYLSNNLLLSFIHRYRIMWRQN